MRKFLERLNPTSLIYNIFGILLAICIWISSACLLVENASVWSILLCAALTIGNALLSSVLAFEAGITSTRHLVPIHLYLLTMAAFPILIEVWELQLVIILIQSCLWFLHTTYRQSFAAEQSFLTTILLLIVTLLVPDAIILIPALWLCFVFHGSFSLRIILASFIAVAVFALYFFLMQHFGWIPLESWNALFVRDHCHTWTVLSQEIGTYLFFLISLIFFLLRYQKEKNSLTAYIFSIGVLALFSTISCFWMPLNYHSLFCAIAYFTVCMMTYFACCYHTIVSGIISLIYQLFLIASFILALLIK